MERASAEAERPHASVLAQITEEMVRIYKEQFGRGPTTARTDFAGPDALLCTLENTFTPVERNLAVMNEHQRLRDTRLFQYATVSEFVEAVERLTGRRVRAFVSGIDTAKDVAAEVFYLEPQRTGQLEPDEPTEGATGYEDGSKRSLA